MQGLATALAVVRKDFQDLQSNRALLFSMVAGIVLAVAFVRLGERAQAFQAVRMVVVAPDAGRLLTELTLTGAFRITEVASREVAEEDVREGRADLGVVLPAGFEEGVRRGEKPRVALITRKDAGPRTLVGVTALSEMMRVKAGQRPPVEFAIDALGADDSRVRTARMVSGWVLFILMMGMTMAAASMVEERERGTLQAIFVTRARLAGVLAGKLIYGFVLCLGSAVIIATACGSLLPGAGPRLAVLVAGAAFCASLGLLLGTLFPNLAAANAGLSVVFLVLFVPVFMADILQGTPLGAGWTRLLPSHTLHDGLVRCFGQDGSTDGVPATVGILGAWSVASIAASWAWMKAEYAR